MIMREQFPDDDVSLFRVTEAVLTEFWPAHNATQRSHRVIKSVV